MTVDRTLVAAASAIILTVIAVILLAIRIVVAAPAPRSLPATVLRLDLATPTSECAGTVDQRLAVFSIRDGASMWDAFPAHGRSPELDSVRVPMLAVVYRDGWPGAVGGRLVNGTIDRTPPPGTYDICLETLDGSAGLGGAPFIVYGGVSDVGAVVEAAR